MTVRQLYYTSCERGRDNIYGFQVNAATPGIPVTLERLAVQASSYEPTPGRLSVPDRDPEDYPTALGFVRGPGGLVLFCSRYTGRDFTGRLGNYFAHAVIVEDPSVLGSLLPIDLWRSPVWRCAPVDDPVLAPVGILTTGSGAGPREVSALVRSRPGRLTALLGAVQRELARPAGGVVAVTDTDVDAARWIAAVTRSLPRNLALQTTFLTWSSRPGEADAVLTFTTPEARVDSHVSTSVLNLTEEKQLSPDEPTTTFASTVTAAWAAGGNATARLVALADRVRPALTAAELDDFAAATVLLEPRPRDLGAESVRGLRLLIDRMAGVPQPEQWDEIWRRVVETLGEDLEPLPELVTAAIRAGLEVPPTARRSAARRSAQELLRTGRAPSGWLRALSPPERTEVVTAVLLPAVLSRPDDAATVIATGDDDLRAVLAGALEDAGNLDRLPPDLAAWLEPAAVPGGALACWTRLVLARAGRLDRADTVAGLVASVPSGRQNEMVDVCADFLWPARLDLGEVAELLNRLDAGMIGRTGLPFRVYEQITEDARNATLTPRHSELIGLLRARFDSLVPPDPHRVLDAVVLGQALLDEAHPVRTDDLEEAVRLADQRRNPDPDLPGGLRRWLLRAAAGRLLRLPDADQHHRVLSRNLTGRGSDLFADYRAQVRATAPDGNAEWFARTAAVWTQLEPEYRDLLIGELLPELLRSRRRDRDRIAQVYARPPADLARLAARRRRRPSEWRDWWDDWRVEHERPTLGSRLRGLVSRDSGPGSWRGRR